jgi:hypothetical protein
VLILFHPALQDPVTKLGLDVLEFEVSLPIFFLIQLRKIKGTFQKKKQDLSLLLLFLYKYIHRWRAKVENKRRIMKRTKEKTE